MKSLILRLLPIADLLLSPFIYISARLLKIIRRLGLKRLPLSRRILIRVGVLPVIDHYYEPQFKFGKEDIDSLQKRKLPGIDWNVTDQLEVLKRFKFSNELADIPTEKSGEAEFYWKNGSFESGDAEYWYQIIRAYKPKKIIEIGSGFSTLLAIKAIKRNALEDHAYTCEHICIEPYEMPWLEKTGVTVMRKKVEDLELEYFSALQKGDILFIDSSHVIRPHGDVLFEFLEILPTLNKGVIVHVHDIFSPRNYLQEWLLDDIKLWNEQYLLEAFLTHNKSWEILGALNFLRHNHNDQLRAVAPYMSSEREPGSFYLQKVS